MGNYGGQFDRPVPRSRPNQAFNNQAGGQARFNRPPLRPSPRTSPVVSVPRPVPLNEALKQDPVDFKGSRFTPKPAPTTKPKPAIDVSGLRDLLEKSIKQKE